MHATKVCKSSITMSLIKIIFAMRNTAFIKGNDKVKADYDGSKGIRCRVPIIVTDELMAHIQCCENYLPSFLMADSDHQSNVKIRQK